MQYVDSLVSGIQVGKNEKQVAREHFGGIKYGLTWLVRIAEQLNNPRTSKAKGKALLAEYKVVRTMLGELGVLFEMITRAFVDNLTVEAIDRHNIM